MTGSYRDRKRQDARVVRTSGRQSSDNVPSAVKPNRFDELLHEPAADDGHLGASVFLKRLERKRETDDRPAPERRTIRLRNR
jgi:hypothetical protein